MATELERSARRATEPERTRQRSYAREGGLEPRRATRPTSGDDGSRALWDGRSVPALFRELSGEVADLARLEVELAKAEMNEKLDHFQRNMVKVTIGGMVMLGALLILTWAVNLALTALLAQWVAVEIAVWLSPLILASVLAIVGWSMLQGGRRAMRREGLAPRQTRETLEEDRRWAEDKARQIEQEMKEDLRHG